MNNMRQMLAKAQKLQAQMTEKQNELAKEEITGTAGSEAIKVTMTLDGNVKAVSIDKSVIDPEDKEMLEDLVLAALNDAKQKADAKYNAEMQKVTGGFNIPGLF